MNPDTAIPKEILIHSCMLKLYKSDGIFGEPVLMSETLLSNVRCSLHRTSKASCDGYAKATAGTLYYDCQNSTPSDVSFMENGCVGIIVFKGHELRIIKIRYIYGSSGLHHLEIELEGAD